MSTRHIPIRSCISCRKKVDKWQLVRLVRGQDGYVVVDRLHTKLGRGAYVCSDSYCWRVASGGKVIGYHLRAAVQDTNRIRNEIEAVSMSSNQI